MVLVALQLRVVRGMNTLVRRPVRNLPATAQGSKERIPLHEFPFLCVPRESRPRSDEAHGEVNIGGMNPGYLQYRGARR